MNMVRIRKVDPSTLPRNGADQIWTWVRYQGVTTPVVASDDQYCLQFPDGSQQWVEKWDVEPLWWDRQPGEVERMKEDAARRDPRNHPTERYRKP